MRHALPLIASSMICSLILGPAQAQLSHPVDLGSLNGAAGVRVDARSPGDRCGRSVSGVGDFNGDGLADFLMGAELANPGSANSAGESYLVYGSASLGHPVDLADLNGANGVRFAGIDSYDWSGRCVSGAGDVNGDGLPDLLIAAPHGDPNGNTHGGETYLVYGTASLSHPFDLNSLNGTNGVRFDGIDASDNSGFSISGVGDVNADGFDDLVIGAYEADPSGNTEAGETYLVLGSASLPHPFSLDSLVGGNGIRIDGIDAEDESGRSVSGVGDVNGDGYADLLIGAHSADPGGDFNAGEAYLVYGSTTVTHPLSLSAIDGTNGIRIDGIDPEDHCGLGVSGVGDVNGDGYADLLVGSSGGDPGGDARAGESHLIYGSPSLPHPLSLSTINGANGVRLDGIDLDDYSGRTVSGAGDINGDGLADFAIGAWWADPGGDSEAGETYLIYGSASLPHPIDLAALDGSVGTRLDGIAADDESGEGVSGAGDVNGDGLHDLLIGAPNGGQGGEVYLVYGAGTAPSATSRAFIPPGNAPRVGVGLPGDGSIETPATRCWVDFTWGMGTGINGASELTAILNRSQPIVDASVADRVAPVHWEVTMTRSDWASAEMTFHYLDSEVAGLNEGDLVIYHAPVNGGPYAEMSTVLDTARNRATVTLIGSAPGSAVFALGESGLVQTPLKNQILQHLLFETAYDPTVDVNGDGTCDVADLVDHLNSL